MKEERIIEVLSKIKEPFLNLDFVKLDFIKHISLNGKNLMLTLGISDLNENILNETREKIKKSLRIRFLKLKMLKLNL